VSAQAPASVAGGAFELQVARVVAETADACSVIFEVPVEEAARLSYAPGQFLTVAIPSDRTGLVARSYSLSSSPLSEDLPGEHLTITVKRTVGGYASNWICDHLRPGDRLQVLPPAGVFTPSSVDADLLLLAAGSGITPMLSILRTALARGTGQVVLFYANRDEKSVIFAAELATLAAAHPDRLRVAHWWESEHGLPTVEGLTELASMYGDREAMVCGPTPFMATAMDALRAVGFPRERRRQETFVSLTGNPFAGPSVASRAPNPEAADVAGTRLDVTLAGNRHVFDDWGPDTTLLDHLESKGLDAPFSCREGECASCAVRLVLGDVQMAVNNALDDAELAEGIRLACQSTPSSAAVTVVYD
jgi:3-ketosteroid 9alpha-monooxygenase subunit B